MANPRIDDIARDVEDAAIGVPQAVTVPFAARAGALAADQQRVQRARRDLRHYRRTDPLAALDRLLARAHRHRVRT